MNFRVSVGAVVLLIALIVYGVSLGIWIVTLQAGVDSVEQVATTYCSAAALATTQRINDHLQSAERVTSTTALMFYNGAYSIPDRPDPRGVEVTTFLLHFRSLLYGMRLVTTVSMTDHRGNLFGVYNNFDFTFAGMWHQYADNVTGEPTLVDYETYPSGSPSEGQIKGLIGITVPYNSSEQVWYTVVNTSDPVSSAWTPMYTMGSQGVVTSMVSQSRTVRRNDGSLIGVVSIDMATGFVGAALSQLTDARGNMQIFAVDAKAAALLGTSAADSIIRCANASIPLANCSSSDQVFLNPSECTNSMVRSVSAKLLSIYGDWNLVPPTQLSDNGLLIASQVIERNNLRWVVVVTIIKSTLTAAVDDSKSRMTIVQVVCGVVISVLCVVVAFGIRRPLAALVEQMELLQRFDVSHSVSVSSILSEIAMLQAGHLALQQSLTKVRSFVPQSLLSELERSGDTSSDDDDIDEDDNDDEGSLVPSHRYSVASSTLRAQQQHALPLVAEAPGISNSSDTVSISRRSTQSGKRAVIAISPESVSRRRVTMLSVGVSGFHRLTEHSAPDAFTTLMRQLVSFVMLEVRSRKGVLDFFQGDHFMISFNAVTPVTAHVRMAVSAAIAIRDACASAKPHTLTTKMGIASSQCHCGNVGSAEVKRFAIVGSAFSVSAILSRLCGAYDDVPILATEAVLHDAEGLVVSDLVDVVQFPQPTGRTVIGVPRALVSGGSDEWMYDIKDHEAAHNAEFMSFLNEAPSSSVSEVPDALPTAGLTPQDLLATLKRLGVDGRRYSRILSHFAL